jgi:hypothetical protein
MIVCVASTRTSCDDLSSFTLFLAMLVHYYLRYLQTEL